MKITMIAALDEHNGIGLNGEMPWHCPADLRQFRNYTMGKTVIVGRRTWEALPKELPGRKLIVVSRTLSSHNVTVCASLDQAIQESCGQNELIIAGGGQLYRQALTKADMLRLSRIPGIYGCDTFFPEWDRRQWELISSKPEDGFRLECWKRKCEAS